LRRIAPADAVTVIADEAQPFYSKVLLSYFLGDRIPYENMMLSSAEALREEGIELRTGTQAVRVDAAARTVTVTGGERIPYDRLLLATGGSPAKPPVEGLDLPGVFTLWSHDDSVNLKGWVNEGQRAVVIGAGLVGLKTAQAFVQRGLAVTVVEMMHGILPQVLAKEDADRAQRVLESKGLSFRMGTGLGRISGEGRVQRVELTDGSSLECDVLVVATGVRPNLSLARSAGVAAGRGILVDEYLQTNVAGIYAAGDVAEGWDVARGRKLPNPTWGNAAEQGRVAAHNMAGRRKPFSGAVTMRTFTFLGFSMATLGITQPEGDYIRVKTYTDPSTGDYRKLVLMGDQLIGAVAMGDIRMAGVWRGLIARRSGGGAVAEALLPGKTSFAWTHKLGMMYRVGG
jgi:nitrite reductase (NADH) large subunit